MPRLTLRLTPLLREYVLKDGLKPLKGVLCFTTQVRWISADIDILTVLKILPSYWSDLETGPGGVREAGRTPGRDQNSGAAKLPGGTGKNIIKS